MTSASPRGDVLLSMFSVLHVVITIFPGPSYTLWPLSILSHVKDVKGNCDLAYFCVGTQPFVPAQVADPEAKTTLTS